MKERGFSQVNLRQPARNRGDSPRSSAPMVKAYGSQKARLATTGDGPDNSYSLPNLPKCLSVPPDLGDVPPDLEDVPQESRLGGRASRLGGRAPRLGHVPPDWGTLAAGVILASNFNPSM